MLSAPSSEMLSARPPSLPSCCPTVSGLSSRFTFGGRVRRELRAHALPDDELLADAVSLDPSAPDSTVAVHADGVVTLSVDRYLDELRLWHDSHHPLSSELSGPHGGDFARPGSLTRSRTGSSTKVA